MTACDDGTCGLCASCLAVHGPCPKLCGTCPGCWQGHEGLFVPTAGRRGPKPRLPAPPSLELQAGRSPVFDSAEAEAAARLSWDNAHADGEPFPGDAPEAPPTDAPRAHALVSQGRPELEVVISCGTAERAANVATNLSKEHATRIEGHDVIVSGLASGPAWALARRLTRPPLVARVRGGA
jgi:hypothetical protein